MIRPMSTFLWCAIAITLIASFPSTRIRAQQSDQSTPNHIQWNEAIIKSPLKSNPLETLLDNFGTTQQRKRFEKLKAVAKEIGLEGKWIVLGIENDGKLSSAQIGQKLNDVISIKPGEDTAGPFAFG